MGLAFVSTIFGLATFLSRQEGENGTPRVSLLIGYGIGLLIIGYVIYLLASPNATVMFSTGYREVIKATPHLKYKTSCLLKGSLLLLIGIVLLGIAGFVFRSSQVGRSPKDVLLSD